MLDVECRLRDLRGRCGIEALEYHHEIGSKVLVPKVVRAAASQGLTAPFEDVAGYLSVVVRPAIEMLWLNTKVDTNEALRRELQDRVRACAAPYAVDFPVIKQVLQPEIPPEVDCETILKQVAARALREAEEFIACRGLRVRTVRNVQVVFEESNDPNASVSAHTDRGHHTITVELNPASMTCADFVTLDHVLVHEYVSHLTSGLSAQETQRGWTAFSTFFDGMEWEAVSEDYAWLRARSDPAPPPRHELRLHVATARNEASLSQEARLGIQATEGMKGLLGLVRRSAAFWSLIDAVHHKDFQDVDPKYGHDAVTIAALRWIEETLALTDSYRTANVNRLADQLAHVQTPEDALAALV